MWKFETPQKQFEIGGVKVGGLPGQRPTVLIGSIFYHKHKIVTDDVKGEFDRTAAEQMINAQDEFSKKTGNPCMIDVVASTPEAIVKYLDFTAGLSDAPLLIGGTTAGIRLAGLDYARGSGLTGRVVYNSLTPSHSKKELEKIKEVGVKSAVFLAMSFKSFTSQGRVASTEEILPTLAAAGIENILVDTCVIDIPTLGQACKAIREVKNRFGLPAGCGAHNAVATWRGLKEKMGRQAVKPALASASVVAAAAGADFVLYGPIEGAEVVFPTVAMVDTAFSQLLIEKGERLNKEHPRYKIS